MNFVSGREVWPACFPDVSCCLRTDGKRAAPARRSSRHRLLSAFVQNVASCLFSSGQETAHINQKKFSPNIKCSMCSSLIMRSSGSIAPNTVEVYLFFRKLFVLYHCCVSTPVSTEIYALWPRLYCLFKP